jgi:hypothetical protein
VEASRLFQYARLQGASPRAFSRTCPRICQDKSISEDRQHAHDLIDSLPEPQLSALVGLLETIVDPINAALRNAPIDDEPETKQEKQSVAEAREWLKRNGKCIPHEEAMRRLGLEVRA